MTYKTVKMYLTKTKFPVLSFCGLHTKPCGLHGLSKHFRFCLYHKLVHVNCTKLQIYVAYVVCTNMFYKLCDPCVSYVKNPATSLLWTAHTGLFWAPSTTGTSFNLQIKLHSVMTVMIFIRFSLISP